MTAVPIRLLRSFATVGGWTMASRVLGFARDILIAALLGAGPVAQAFVIAFTLPNLFRRFFAEGALNTAFIPMFAKRLEGDGEREARAFAEEALAVLATVLIVFTVLAQLAMPWLVLALASGYAGDVRFDLSVVFGRIAFPYILFISLTALLSGVLNALGRFAVAAAAPVLLNVILIGALLLSESGWFDEVAVGVPGAAGLAGLNHGTMLVWGVVVAGIGQLALCWWAAARAGMGLRLRLPKITPRIRRLAWVALPAALAGGVMQINLVVSRQVASYFEGAVAWLYYADRVYQLPLGVVGVAIGVVLLPELSRRVRAEDVTGARDAMNRAAEFCLVLALPATAALIAMPELVARVLFERGAFEAEDARATGLAISVYALGLPAFVLHKVLQPVFFAREDTASPFRYAAIAMVVNVVVAVGLAPLIGWIAAALGTTVSAWVMLWLLWRGAARFGAAAALDERLAGRWPRILAASALMGIAVWALAQGVVMLPEVWEVFGFTAVVVAGLIIYGAACGLTGAFRLAEVRAAMSRGRGA